MTDIFKTPKKLGLKNLLFQIALETLRNDGWVDKRIPGLGKSSVRRISKGNLTKTVSIRTSQDTWIAFPRNSTNNGWETLEDADYVVAASVDDPENPQFAQIHLIDGAEMRARFDRAWAARSAAGHALPVGRGVWISLYHKESDFPVNRVGAGAGLAHPAMARVPLAANLADQNRPNPHVEETRKDSVSDDSRLTIPEAKRLLAISLGVNEADIRITING